MPDVFWEKQSDANPTLLSRNAIAVCCPGRDAGGCHEQPRHIDRYFKALAGNLQVYRSQFTIDRFETLDGCPAVFERGDCLAVSSSCERYRPAAATAYLSMRTGTACCSRGSSTASIWAWAASPGTSLAARAHTKASRVADSMKTGPSPALATRSAPSTRPMNALIRATR